MNPIGIRSCYDEGKGCAGTLFFDYYRGHSIDIKIGRIFNTYGPRMAIDDGRVVSNFILQVLKDIDITIFGDGSQTKSFCFVSDLINGIIKLMKKEKGFTGPVNLGNPVEIKISELAELIVKTIGSKTKISFTELPKYNPKRKLPDISVTKEHLSWKPKTDLYSELIKIMSYVEKNL